MWGILSDRRGIVQTYEATRGHCWQERVLNPQYGPLGEGTVSIIQTVVNVVAVRHLTSQALTDRRGDDVSHVVDCIVQYTLRAGLA